MGEEGEKSEEKDNKNNLNMQTSLDFIINNPQIVIQDEIKGSALLLTCKEPIISIFHNCWISYF